MKYLSIISFPALIFILASCGSESGTSPQNNTANAGSSSSGFDISYSSSIAAIPSSCLLSQGLPAWTGTTALVWQENVGNNCYASLVTTVSEITNYENALKLASWKSALGWTVVGPASTNTYTKAKNLDSTFSLIVAGDANTSIYTFSLSLKETVYAYPIDRVFASLPEWNGKTKLVWGNAGRHTTDDAAILPLEISSYSALLVSDGWVFTPPRYTNELRLYLKVINGVTYTVSFSSTSSGLTNISLGTTVNN